MKLYKRQTEVVDEAVKILNQYGLVYLALSPRYGKTLISLTITKRLKSKSTLFVTTKSAIKGIKETKDKLHIKTDIDIINYQSLHKISIKHYDIVIIDEAHSNISSFPKDSKTFTKLQQYIGQETRVIYLSGTPNVESSSQLMQQLRLSLKHSFSTYDSFYHLFNGSNHYQNKIDNKIGYGIKGLTKFTGGSRPSIDYSHTKDFSDKYEPIMIKRTLDIKPPKFITHSLDMPPKLRDIYNNIKIHSIAHYHNNVFIANGGAAKLSKLSQLCGGTCIDENNSHVLLNEFKAKSIQMYQKDKKIAIWYKYEAHRAMLSKFFNEKDLYQTDSQITGLDLSHYDELVIYSNTWSGANFQQLTERLTNSERKTQPIVNIFIYANTVESDTLQKVMSKRDNNLKFLKG